MGLPISPHIYKLEREIAALSFEEKLWLLAQIAQQVQPSFAAKIPIETPNVQQVDVEISESAPLLEDQLIRKGGVLVLEGALEDDVEAILDTVREERIQELMGM